MPRKVVIAGNWKMYKGPEDAAGFFEQFAPAVSDVSHPVYLAVSYTLISMMAEFSSGSHIVIGAQNMHDAEEGAYTGEISAAMLKSAGAGFVLLGHSERRHLFGEQSAFINRKVKRALASQLQPFVCIGETRKEREAGQTELVLKRQLLESLADLSEAELGRTVIAYEPVWAIGTGLTATPEQAQTAHAFCRKVLADGWSSRAADGISILYGGSVKPDNVRSIMGMADVDGVLVGGASLKPDAFAQIVNYQTLKV